MGDSPVGLVCRRHWDCFTSILCHRHLFLVRGRRTACLTESKKRAATWANSEIIQEKSMACRETSTDGRFRLERPVVVKPTAGQCWLTICRCTEDGVPAEVTLAVSRRLGDRCPCGVHTRAAAYGASGAFRCRGARLRRVPWPRSSRAAPRGSEACEAQATCCDRRRRRFWQPHSRGRPSPSRHQNGGLQHAAGVPFSSGIAGPVGLGAEGARRGLIRGFARAVDAGSAGSKRGGRRSGRTRKSGRRDR